MPLNARPSSDVRWAMRHRSVMEGWQWATVLVVRRATTATTWNPETNETTGEGLTALYYGQARIIPNQAWRARRHNGEDSPMVQQAVLVQMPMAECPPVLTSDIIGSYGSPFDDQLGRYVMRVRNPTQSSNPWGRSVLTDVDTTEDRAMWAEMDQLARDHGWDGTFGTIPGAVGG